MMMFLAAAVLMGCEDEDAIRVPELREGASLRITFPDPDLSFFNFEDPSTSRVQFNLYSQNRNIDSVNIYATYFSAAEGTTSERRLIRTYRQNDFTNGILTDGVITLSEAASAFGRNLGDIQGGDRFEFFNEMVLTDGRKFPSEVELPGITNSNTVRPEIANRSVQTSSFNAGFTSFVACPLPPGYAVGRYRLEQTEGPTDPFFGNPYRFAPAEVNISQTSPIDRRFSLTYLTFEGRTFNFQLICDNLLIPETSSGIGCGGPTFTWRTGTTAGTYDVASDDVLVLEIMDNVTGACGLSPNQPATLTLTRIN
jgi:hypothetical protein